jgi:Flp pilus assembly protein TadB
VTEPGASKLARVAALIAGVGVFLIASLVTVGTVLAAPLGVFLIRRHQRRRSRRFDPWEMWFGAVTAVTIALVFVGFALATRIPPGTLSQIQRAADSASVASAKQQPPAWLTRIAPEASRRAQANNAAMSHSGMMLFGLAIGACMLGGFVGTIGWVGSILFVFYSTGRWFGVAPPVPADIE